VRERREETGEEREERREKREERKSKSLSRYGLVSSNHPPTSQSEQDKAARQRQGSSRKRMLRQEASAEALPWSLCLAASLTVLAADVGKVAAALRERVGGVKTRGLGVLGDKQPTC
jgi:hypothetical protein